MTLAAVQRGTAAIAAAFGAAGSEDRAALMPYYTAGFPDYETSLAVLRAIAGSGADLIEIGTPFSDPLADGPVIQMSTQAALDNGMTAAGALDLVAGLRKAGVTQPLVLMGYVNPILAYGSARYARDAAAAGADGLIIPDLPPEEAGEIEGACAAAGLALIYLAAPTSTPERLAEIARRTTGFLYLVSVTGVTGARTDLPPDLAAFVARARAVARTPLAVGFGIATREQVRAVGALADGVIVGSALIRAVAAAPQNAEEAAAGFIRGLARGEDTDAADGAA